MSHDGFPVHTKSIIHAISSSVPVTDKEASIRSVKELLFTHAKEYDSISYIYVLSTHKKLLGVLSIQELLIASESAKVEQVMTKEVSSVHPHSHQEKAAQTALRHSIKAVPVVDKENIFLGVVLSDTILQITNDELTEDILLLEGIYTKEYNAISTIDNPPLKLTRKRLPWLIVGLAGGIIAAQIIGTFETLLTEEVLLIGFLPLMVYISDAVGSQSQTIYIRYIALHNNSQFPLYLLKETIIGVLIGLSLALLLGIYVAGVHYPLIGIVLGVSLFLTVILSVLIAIIIPWILTKLHKDPAVASGPFATIIRDIMSIIVYFAVSSLLFSAFRS